MVAAAVLKTVEEIRVGSSPTADTFSFNNMTAEEAKKYLDNKI